MGTECEGVEEEKFAGEDFAHAREDFNSFIGLEGADDSREDADDANFGAIGNVFGIWALWEETAIRGTVLVVEDGDLPFELEDRAEGEGFAEFDAGVVDEVAGGEVVGTVEDEVVVGEKPFCIFGGEAFDMRAEFNLSLIHI